MKKGIRIDMERVQKVYAALDKTLRDLKIRPTGAEMFLVCYFLMRTLEKAGEQTRTVHVQKGGR